jgi:hypothetical protein
MNGLTLAPNPASNTVEVTITQGVIDSTATSSITSGSISDLTNYTVRILNLYGTQVYTTQKSGASFLLPVGNLPNGVYLIVVDDGKDVYSQQFIIKH